MPAYLVVSVTYHSLDWIEAYRSNVPALVAAYGGRYLAKSLHPEKLEGNGETADTLTILEFPTKDAARALLASPAYEPYAKTRQLGATTSMFII
jgi:uncharacterized protein (DUF1330 family)